MPTYRCNVCGFSNPETAKSCSNCGAPIEPRSPSRVGKPGAESQADVPPTGRILDPNHIQGKVRGFQSFSNRGKLVWTFVVEEYSEDGNIVDIVQVQMEAVEFSGSVGDGDEVKFKARRSAHRPLRIKELYNLSRRSVVRAAGPSPWLVWLFAILFIGLFLFLIGGVLSDLLRDRFIGTNPIRSNDIILTDCQITVTDSESQDAKLMSDPTDEGQLLEVLQTDEEYVSDLKRGDRMPQFFRIKTDEHTGWIWATGKGIRASDGCLKGEQ